MTQFERQVLQSGGHVRSQTKIEEVPGPSPPRPPAPADADVLAVPPPRPPAPQASPLPPEAYLYVPPLVSIVPAWQHGTPRVGGGIVIHHIINVSSVARHAHLPTLAHRHHLCWRWAGGRAAYGQEGRRGLVTP